MCGGQMANPKAVDAMMKKMMAATLAAALSACGALPASKGMPAAATRMIRLCPDADAALAGLRHGKDIGAPGKDACAGDRLRYVAHQLVQDGKPDYTRAYAQLEAAQQSLKADGGQEGLNGLAALLAGQLGERRRLEEQLNRLNGQLSEQQRRADDLAAKLDALRAIEKSMADKARLKKTQP